MWEYGEAIRATSVAHGAANSVARNRSLAFAPRDVVAGVHLCYHSEIFGEVIPLELIYHKLRITEGGATLSPIRRALYSASLLVALNPMRIEYSICLPNGVWRTGPAPQPCWLDDPSTNNFHLARSSSGFCSSVAFFSSGVSTLGRITSSSRATSCINSAMKLANAWTLNAILGLVCQHSNGMSLEIMSKLFGGDQKCIGEFFDFHMSTTLTIVGEMDRCMEIGETSSRGLVFSISLKSARLIKLDTKGLLRSPNESMVRRGNFLNHDLAGPLKGIQVSNLLGGGLARRLGARSFGRGDLPLLMVSSPLVSLTVTRSVKTMRSINLLWCRWCDGRWWIIGGEWRPSRFAWLVLSKGLLVLGLDIRWLRRRHAQGNKRNQPGRGHPKPLQCEDQTKKNISSAKQSTSALEITRISEVNRKLPFGEDTTIISDVLKVSWSWIPYEDGVFAQAKGSTSPFDEVDDGDLIEIGDINIYGGYMNLKRSPLRDDSSHHEEDPEMAICTPLEKELNVMTQDDLDRLRETYSFPAEIQARIPKEGEVRQEFDQRVLQQRQGVEEEILFYLGRRLGVLLNIAWKYFTLDRERMSFSGGDNAEGKSVDGAIASAGDEGESHHSRDEPCPGDLSRDDSVEYIGTIRKEMRRIFPHLPDLTRLRCSNQTQGCPSSLDQKVEESKGVSSSTKSPQAVNGVVIKEKRPRDEVSDISPSEAKSKGKDALPPPMTKKAKSSTISSATAIKGARLAAAPREGTLANPSNVLGPRASMLGSPSVAKKILEGMILPVYKDKVDKLSLDQATKELKKKIEAVARLKAEVVELKKNEAFAKRKAIEEFKSSNDFQEAVESTTSKYFAWHTSAHSFFLSRRSRLSLSSVLLFSLSKFEVLKLCIPISTGITNSVPYTIENSVSPVGILLVVCTTFTTIGKMDRYTMSSSPVVGTVSKGGDPRDCSRLEQLVNDDLRVYPWNIACDHANTVFFLQKFHQSTPQLFYLLRPDHNVVIWIIGMYGDWRNFFQRLDVLRLFKIIKGHWQLDPPERVRRVSFKSDQRGVKRMELISPNLYFGECRDKHDIYRTTVVNQDPLRIEISDGSRDD
ncbi:hypothetical protein Acr_06g0008410 [Actinidia rufa]|uniref:Uncharacterized protein n=1 Tax=Actinidia rufa TaxID=165716 RepID=A0A7J0EQY9_9ERIC|nr:hypothetical protein Acr_06g0008410 [Actinidia rufa]